MHMNRPKTYSAANGKGGGRQKMWDALRKAKAPLSAADLVEVSGSAESSVRSYLHELRRHGYLSQEHEGSYVLIKNTGKRAPSVNMAERTLYDWNLNPPMTGKQLKALWEKSGLSIAQWARNAGMISETGALGHAARKGGDTHRIIEMFDGKRPVSPAIEAKAKAFDETNATK